MKRQLYRRRFLQTSGLFLAGSAVPSLVGGVAAAQGAPQRIRKAVGWEMIQGNLSLEDKLRLAKDVGFEGIEINTQRNQPGAIDPKQLARASEKVGIPIHGVSNGSHPDIRGAIDQAAVYGATSVLLVVRSDPQAPLLETYRRSQDAIRAAIPHAEKQRIPILIENVWATFLIEPMTMARYIDELNSPYVKAYFDVGNVMRWGWPQHWIEVLGKRIAKIHLKEYNLKVAMNEGMGKGFNFPLGQGDIDWPRVRQQLQNISFAGWATAEVRGGDAQHLAAVSAQMDKVLAL